MAPWGAVMRLSSCLYLSDSSTVTTTISHSHKHSCSDEHTPGRPAAPLRALQFQRRAPSLHHTRISCIRLSDGHRLPFAQPRTPSLKSISSGGRNPSHSQNASPTPAPSQSHSHSPSHSRQGVPPCRSAAEASAHTHEAAPAAAGGVPGVNPVVADVQRKLPFWASDFADGVHPQALAAVAFLAFACLTPCIAFGSLTAAQTGGAIGVVETVLGTAASGVVYALLSGQPLTLLGPTGLVVVFTGLLYKASGSLGLPFLPVYGWVSLWSAAFLFVLALTGASDLIHYFTRFTDDTFSVLISLGFISEACKNLAKQFATLTVVSPLTGTADISAPLLSGVVAISTWLLAASLTQLRHTKLFVASVRSFLADFGPPIAIFTMSLLPRLLFPNTPLPTLAPPASGPAGASLASSGASLASALATTSGRPWVVPLGSLPAWAAAACSVPAALLTLLVFLDQNITTRLVDAPENGLTKGSGYHLDLAVLAVLMLLSAAVGAPWMVATTVPSLAHVRSLATTAPEAPSAPSSGAQNGSPVAESAGEGSGRRGVRENRITGLAIHVAVGASALLLSFLGLVPSAVAQGLFIFMGVSGLANNQLVERVKLWICDPSQYPALPFIKGIPVKAVHAFTALQVTCLGLLWQLKHSRWGIFFPLLILALMPIRRYLAPIWFSEPELAVLDSH